MKKLLIIIPAYNEQESITRVVENLKQVCPSYDFVVVNDGSTDSTAGICRKNGYPLLDLPVNLGLSSAMQTGMRYANRRGYDCTMQFDADGQHLPEYIEPLMRKLEDGADIVIGSRFINVRKPKTLRMAGSYLLSWT
ncbi:MAG: glycosyltransferase family 2 protein, partial [Oscillospiraceae bacterium]